MDIDKQRITAVRTLQGLGYTFSAGEWYPPHAAVGAPPTLTIVQAEADAMHGLLMRRADALAGCTKGSDEEGELEATIDALEAYEAKRWPLGKERGGKG
jgi:hypothetical protein